MLPYETHCWFWSLYIDELIPKLIWGPDLVRVILNWYPHPSPPIDLIFSPSILKRKKFSRICCLWRTSCERAVNNITEVFNCHLQCFIWVSRYHGKMSVWGSEDNAISYLFQHIPHRHQRISLFLQYVKKWSEIKFMMRNFVFSAARKWTVLANHFQASQSARAKSTYHLGGTDWLIFITYRTPMADQVRGRNCFQWMGPVQRWISFRRFFCWLTLLLW